MKTHPDAEPINRYLVIFYKDERGKSEIFAAFFTFRIKTTVVKENKKNRKKATLYVDACPYEIAFEGFRPPDFFGNPCIEEHVVIKNPDKWKLTKERAITLALRIISQHDWEKKYMRFSKPVPSRILFEKPYS